MTQSENVEEFQDGMTVEEGQRGKAIEQGSGGDIAAPQLAAIQRNYEEARAYIAGLAYSSWHGAQDVTDPYPDTEEIDIRLVKPPAVHDASTPPTTAMSVAARFLAERPVIEEVRSPENQRGPRSEPHAASRTWEAEMRAPHLHTDLPVVHRPRRWWRATRTTRLRAVPAPR